VEISSELEEKPVHILGYGFDLGSSSLGLFLKEIQKRRAERNRSILQKLKAQRMPIEESELAALNTRTIGRPHIAQLMVKKGYVSSVQTAFDRYLKNGACCYAHGFKYTPKEAIEAIQQAKGKAILAHPHFYKKGALLKKILSCPFDGIECYYASLPKELERPWLQLAKERGWIATGGSDYHGAFKNNLLGSSWVNEATFKALLLQ
jgi:predicted metal-dependent phosphoesterase TrpH